jgi:hypothetical protein
MALLVSFTLRREPAVFGDVKTGPSLVMVSVRRTWRGPSSRSTASHFNPSSSPWRRPVCIASVAHVGKRVGVDVQTIELESNRIVEDEEHVLLPVPVGARIGMATYPAAGA